MQKILSNRFQKLTTASYVKKVLDGNQKGGAKSDRINSSSNESFAHLILSRGISKIISGVRLKHYLQ